jgi:hypothetical protein
MRGELLEQKAGGQHRLNHERKHSRRKDDWRDVIGRGRRTYGGLLIGGPGSKARASPGDRREQNQSAEHDRQDRPSG